MSLNPFAKEYVPGAITKGVSSLKITGSNEAQPDDQVAPRASEHNLRGALDLRCMGASRVSIVKVQPRAAKPPMAPKTIPKERASEDLDFEELFQGSPSDKGSATVMTPSTPSPAILKQNRER